MKLRRRKEEKVTVRYPGVRAAVDGSEAVVSMETAASEAAGAYPITPSTQMGEGWALAVAAGKQNVFGRRLLFFEPEGEHAAAAVTAGMSMMGLRATNFSSGQGIAYMHESLYPAVGKRLTYVLNVACRAMTKHALNVHAGHDDYHCVDDTGFFQLFAKDVQEVADLNLIGHRVAELALNPGIVAQDGFLTSHVIESAFLPERELVQEYLGDPADRIESPTPAQRLVFGKERRRIPEMFDLDYPAMLGVVQNQDSYAQGVAAQRPFYFDHLVELTERAMDEFAALTGRRYQRAVGHLLDDAEWVIAGQGSVVANAEAVCEHLRATRKLKVGVLNLTMFRPFPSDKVAELLRGKKAVTVLERVDQPLAADAPLLRELRTAMGKAQENARTPEAHPGVPACRPEEVPDFFSGCFGLGSRDLKPGDLVAAIDNMLPAGARRRQFYLGLDFVRQDTRLPKLQIWQQELLDGYPHLATLSLPPVDVGNLMPEGSTSLRIHSVGGWGAITMGKNLAVTASELFGMHIKANPKYGSEKKGQPTTFYATLAAEPIRFNCELEHVDVVLSPDPNVFRHSDPLDGMAAGGVFLIQWDGTPESLWNAFPSRAQRKIRELGIRVYGLDGFGIAAEEASDSELRYRMQGTAFMGAFFHATTLGSDHGFDHAQVLEGLEARIRKKFGHLGERVVDDNFRVIRRGFDELWELKVADLALGEETVGKLPKRPQEMDGTGWQEGIANPGRFWEQVCHLHQTGEDGIADPFAAISAIPAATSTMRDMTNVRFEVPEFVADKCTGCSQCWTLCPDAAIPGMVTPVDQVLSSALRFVESDGGSVDRLRAVVKPLTKEVQRVLKSTSFTTFGNALTLAFEGMLQKMAPPPERRLALEREFLPVQASLAEFPLAKTTPFYDVPESKEKGGGGLLSITVNPQACKGCNLCVEVCPDGALITVKQDEAEVDKLRRNWRLWEYLPDTQDQYVKVASLEDGIGVLSSLLLKREHYRTMVGGDGACMGCGEKTGLHLVLAAVHAWVEPRVKELLVRLDEQIAGLEAKAKELVSADVDVSSLNGDAAEHLQVDLPAEKADELRLLSSSLRALKDLRWRYLEGPSGKGRSVVGFANSTGCSSVWGSTYPFNPYPFPWVNHLFQDAPSIAIGVFEGHMRKMADNFIAIRRANLLLSGEYDAAVHEPFFARFDWREFTDEEMALCPPIFAVGGDGAMLDIGFQNLSRLMASGKPIKVVVLDTQVYSNTGGQACTSGFTSQVSDMAAFGQGQHGKEETRKELALIAIAHRNTYVLQSSQASSSHLLGGVLAGLSKRRPAIFLLHCPCPPEHGIADDSATRQARLALESRAFPFVRYDPDAGDTIADCLDLDGNPALEDHWPQYPLEWVDPDGKEQKKDATVTIADWACTEGRFRKHFKPLKEGVDAIPFAEYFELAPEEREGKTPYVETLRDDQTLGKLSVAEEVVELAEERMQFFSQLKQLAGLEVAPSVRELAESAMAQRMQEELERVRGEYEAQLAAVKQKYPVEVARRLATSLLEAGPERTVAEWLGEAEGLSLPADALVETANGGSLSAGGASASSGNGSGATAVVEPKETATPAADDDEDDDFAEEAYIESARCTSCNECIQVNSKLFAYNDEKQAYIKDAKAGSFKDLVVAAERCPVEIIHPGTPLNPNEKGLDKLLARAERFHG